MLLMPKHLLGICFTQSPSAQAGHASPDGPPAAENKTAAAPRNAREDTHPTLYATSLQSPKVCLCVAHVDMS